jgi:D-glucosaminate-6-phosphate ammonia-lyase
MTDIFQQLGVRTIINAKGTSTRVSGATLAPQVAEAMSQASRRHVDMADLQGRAGQIIAGITGAESALVTSCAAGGLLLGAAACIAGLDPARMNRLPDTDGMANEIVMARGHRNFYDHAIRTAGAKLVDVGISDRFAGAGVRDTEAWEIAAAITEKTAAVFYLAMPHSLPAFPDVVKAVRESGFDVPIMVDAAGQLPPKSNLSRFIDEGADLVIFSGGKAIGGPQASGFMAGRKDLIMSAALQTLDVDIFFDLWNPPESLIDKSKLAGLPQHGIGRSSKAGKEEIVGLLTALRLFLDRDEEAWFDSRHQLAAALHEGLRSLNRAQVELVPDAYRPGIPGVKVAVDPQSSGMNAFDLVRDLHAGEPSIYVDLSALRQGAVVFGSMCLEPDDIPAIIKRVRELLT